MGIEGSNGMEWDGNSGCCSCCPQTTESGGQNQLAGFGTKWRVLRLRWQAASEVTGLGSRKAATVPLRTDKCHSNATPAATYTYVGEFVHAGKWVNLGLLVQIEGIKLFSDNCIQKLGGAMILTWLFRIGF